MVRPYVAEDLDNIAAIRALDWGSFDYWINRVEGYAIRGGGPKSALSGRAIFVYEESDQIVGFIAGHLSTRYDCEGELQWINILSSHQGSDVSASLLKRLAQWYVTEGARRICVDVDPENKRARGFYKKYGAIDLNEHWLVWEDISLAI